MVAVCRDGVWGRCVWGRCVGTVCGRWSVGALCGDGTVWGAVRVDNGGNGGGRSVWTGCVWGQLVDTQRELACGDGTQRPWDSRPCPHLPGPLPRLWPSCPAGLALPRLRAPTRCLQWLCPFIPRSPSTPPLLQSRAPFSLPSLGHPPSPPPWGISESRGQEAGREGPPGGGEEGKWGKREGSTIWALTGGAEGTVGRRPKGLTAPHSLHSPLQPHPQGTECSPHTPLQPGPQETQRAPHRASGHCERPRAPRARVSRDPSHPPRCPRSLLRGWRLGVALCSPRSLLHPAPCLRQR